MDMDTMYSAKEVCDKLGISWYTLANWYRWERKEVNKGATPYLPEPIRDSSMRGRPRFWTSEMFNELKTYKESIVIGRNGEYGEYTNPYHFETKKYKKKQNNGKETD